MKHKKKRCKIVAKSFQNRFKEKKTQEAKKALDINNLNNQTKELKMTMQKN
jgi:hypothetical protein